MVFFKYLHLSVVLLEEWLGKKSHLIDQQVFFIVIVILTLLLIILEVERLMV